MIHGLSPNLHRLLTITSQEEARRVNADYLQPEHIMLALVRNKIGRGYQVLEYLHISFISLQVFLEQNTPIREGAAIIGEIPPSARVKTLLDNAASEARALRQPAIGTEHLILGFIQLDESPLAQFLVQQGIFLDDVRKAINQLFAQEEGGTKNKQDKQTTLQEFSRDLTQITRDGAIDPVIGRTREIKRVMQILSRRNKNNPVLIGEPGVGKTSIVEGLAAAIVKEQVPRPLFGKKILALDLASIIAGTKYRGQFEERIKRIIKEVHEAKDIILFIDEVHTLIGTGGSQGSLDAANMLKPALARGQIQCIGATTFDEYRKYIEKDPALERRFQSVIVKEPSKEETCAILRGLKTKYEQHHYVTYSDEIISKIVELSARYIPDRFFPDKAIDVMDESGALKKIDTADFPETISSINNHIADLSAQKEQLVAVQDFEKARFVRDEVRSLRAELATIKEQWLNQKGEVMLDITSQDIAETISLMTDIPLTHVTADEAKRLTEIEQELHKTIIGQDEAIGIIANAIRRSRAGISSSERPIGSFLFLGPTGVGKTLLAKALAEFLFGSADFLIRVDMSDYMEKHTVARLIGAPPGYVGFENGGLLTEKIRRNPYSVILLDEIEKAHPDVFNLLLQVFEEGELKDSLGHTVNFRNTVIIMTGNIGSKSNSEEPLGFLRYTAQEPDYESLKKTTEAEIKKLFSPEFLNRIDSTVIFTPLSPKHIESVFELELSKLKTRLMQKQCAIIIEEAARTYCIEHGYDPRFGARPMRRLLQKEIEDVLALKIITGEYTEGDAVVVDAAEEALTITIQKKNALSAVCLLPNETQVVPQKEHC